MIKKNIEWRRGHFELIQQVSVRIADIGELASQRRHRATPLSCPVAGNTGGQHSQFRNGEKELSSPGLKRVTCGPGIGTRSLRSEYNHKVAIAVSFQTSASKSPISGSIGEAVKRIDDSREWVDDLQNSFEGNPDPWRQARQL
jgi:hypothetical protein